MLYVCDTSHKIKSITFLNQEDQNLLSTFGEDWIVKHYEIDCIKAENPDYVKDKEKYKKNKWTLTNFSITNVGSFSVYEGFTDEI